MKSKRIDGPVLWRRISLTIVALALVVGLAAPRAASAQVAASDIPQFVGTWNLPLEAQGQSFEMTIVVSEDANGNAAATVSDQMGDVDVETVSLDGETLELAYESSAQGMTFPVLIMLTPGEEEGTAIAELDFADGQFFMDGTATKAE